MSPSTSHTSRLRKTFAYPDSDSDQPLDLDEDEQTQLITALSTANTLTNNRLTNLMTLLPLLATLLYIRTISTHPQATLLALSALLGTAACLAALPAGVTGIPALDRIYAAPAGASTAKTNPPAGPTQTYLPSLTVLLSALLLLTGWLRPQDADAPPPWPGFWSVPAIIHVLVLAFQVEMGSVDPEAELDRLRYGYKGA